jgi:hypothetical protein
MVHICRLQNGRITLEHQYWDRWRVSNRRIVGIRENRVESPRGDPAVKRLESNDTQRI